MWNSDGPLFSTLTGKVDQNCPLLHKLSLRTGEREALEVLLGTIVRELNLQQGNFEVAARLKLAEAIVLLERIAGAAGTEESRNFLSNQEVVNTAITYMEERLGQSITLRDIARAVHLSPNYFCEVFHQVIGQPPGRFLLRLRLEHARYLLLTTPRSITEIAQLCGFADASYFARAFKSHFGGSPSHLRSTGR
jgi:transcriptional regulator GlxA family with amidase domain